MTIKARHWLTQVESDALQIGSTHRGQTEFWDERTGLWYHVDETHSELYGPFETEAEAVAGCKRYAAWLNADAEDAGTEL